MNWSISFEPLISWPLLAAVLVPLALLALAGLWFGQRGAVLRLVALAALAAALFNPVFLDESREPLKSVVALIVDRSPSQDIGERTRQTDEALAGLQQRLGRFNQFDLRVVEAGDGPVVEKPAGEIGEIVVRAASFAQCNWGDPDWQRRVVTPDGWYRTGDRGWVDPDGFVYLQGRVDNQIATGGIKVAPEEIEQVIGTHPGVAAVAVFGADDERWGQRIVALVVSREASLTGAELEQWCRGGERLAAYKCPKQWCFVEALPLTGVGKLDRKALAVLATACAGRIDTDRTERP